MESIKLNAHAKLNLSLEVVGKRPDGYHNIVSLMQGIGLCDAVTIKKCPQNGTKYNLPHCTINGHVVYLCTDEKTIPTDMHNLALKGIAALAEASDARLPDADLIVEIEKRLPVAAGIAGGSGNAAAAMLGLNALADYPLSLRELMAVGAGVGADVPFSIFMNAAANITHTLLGCTHTAGVNTHAAAVNTHAAGVNTRCCGEHTRCWGEHTRCWGEHTHCWGEHTRCWGEHTRCWGEHTLLG